MAAATTSVFLTFLTWSWSINAEPVVKIDSDKLFDFACKTLEYDCSDIPKPEVVFQPIFDYGLLGMFDPAYPDRVVVDNRIGPWLNQAYFESIIAHEYTHYIENKLGLIDLTDYASRCRTEWNGWRVGNAYVTVAGRPDFADFNWHVRYGCTNWESADVGLD